MRPNWSGALAGLTDPLTTVGGVNCVVGVRPSLWRGVAPDDTPADAADWTDDLVGPDGFTMPATPHDAWVWLTGGDRTALFDNARAVLAATASVARLGREVTGWLYRHDRDLTGFIDGTENPTLLEAGGVATVPVGEPGPGSSVLLHQLWRHDTSAWEGIGEHRQELAMGRTKPDSVELDEDAMPASAHVARTSFEIDGVEQHIFRRNVAYGGVTEHGTVFVGFARDQFRLAEMLRRMAGVGDGISVRPDELPRAVHRRVLRSALGGGAQPVRPAAGGLSPSANTRAVGAWPVDRIAGGARRVQLSHSRKWRSPAGP